MNTTTLTAEMHASVPPAATGGRDTRRLAYLVSQLPALSHTFILRKIQALRRRGFRIRVASINAPDRPPAALTHAERVEATRTYYVKRAGLADFSQEQMQFLAWGRGMDTTRMREVLGLEPEFTTRTAYEDFASHSGTGPPGAAITSAAGGLAGSAARVIGRSHALGRHA